MPTIRTRRENRAAADAFIERGEKLHNDVEADMKEAADHCKVSKSLPWLVLWMVEYQLLKVKQNGNGADDKTTLELGPLKITSNSARDLVRVAGVCILAWWVWQQSQLHKKVEAQGDGLERLNAIATQVKTAGPPARPHE